MRQDQNSISNDEPSALVQEYLNKVSIDEPLSAKEIDSIRQQVKQLLVEKNAVIVAHYYTDPLIQALAEETGGIVADSLEMARFGSKHNADTLIVAGVKFMGETAKILTPIKRSLCQHWRQHVLLMWVVLQMTLPAFAISIPIEQWWSMPLPQQK